MNEDVLRRDLTMLGMGDWRIERDPVVNPARAYYSGPSSLGFYGQAFISHDATMSSETLKTISSVPAATPLVQALESILSRELGLAWDISQRVVKVWTKPQEWYDTGGTLHREDGPAVEGPLGELWYWHGKQVTKEFVMAPKKVPIENIMRVDMLPCFLDRVGGLYNFVTHTHATSFELTAQEPYGEIRTITYKEHIWYRHHSLKRVLVLPQRKEAYWIIKRTAAKTVKGVLAAMVKAQLLKEHEKEE